LARIFELSGLFVNDMERHFRPCGNGCSFSISFMSNGRCCSSTVNVRVRSLRSGQWVAKSVRLGTLGSYVGHVDEMRSEELPGD